VDQTYAEETLARAVRVLGDVHAGDDDREPVEAFDGYVLVMEASNIDDSQVLESARRRAFLSLDFVPAEDRWSSHPGLYDAWRAWCDGRGRHPVMVFPCERGGWAVMVGFQDGVDAECEYVRHEIRETFVRHGARRPSPDREEPRVWHRRVITRACAEAVAEGIVAIDSAERDPALEVVFQIHAR